MASNEIEAIKRGLRDGSKVAVQQAYDKYRSMTSSQAGQQSLRDILGSDYAKYEALPN